MCSVVGGFLLRSLGWVSGGSRGGVGGCALWSGEGLACSRASVGVSLVFACVSCGGRVWVGCVPVCVGERVRLGTTFRFEGLCRGHWGGSGAWDERAARTSVAGGSVTNTVGVWRCGCVHPTGPAGRGGGVYLWWVTGRVGQATLGWGGRRGGRFLSSWVPEFGDCGPLTPPLLSPPGHLSLLFLFPFLSPPPPHFCLHRPPGGEVGAGRAAPPGRAGQTLWAPGVAPAAQQLCSTPSVSVWAQMGNGGMEDGGRAPSAPPRLTPPPFPALPLSHLRASPESPGWNQRPRGSLRETVIIFIPVARPCAEIATRTISSNPHKRPSLQMRRPRSREGPARVIRSVVEPALPPERWVSKAHAFPPQDPCRPGLPRQQAQEPGPGEGRDVATATQQVKGRAGTGAQFSQWPVASLLLLAEMGLSCP